MCIRDSYKPARDNILEQLRSDQTLTDLHEQAVKWRKDRFDQLMLQEPYRALFGRLLMAPPSRPVTRKGGQFLIGYATRARNTELSS